MNSNDKYNELLIIFHFFYLGKLKHDPGKWKFYQVVRFDKWPQILIFSIAPPLKSWFQCFWMRQTITISCNCRLPFWVGSWNFSLSTRPITLHLIGLTVRSHSRDRFWLETSMRSRLFSISLLQHWTSFSRTGSICNVFKPLAVQLHKQNIYKVVYSALSSPTPSAYTESM